MATAYSGSATPDTDLVTDYLRLGLAFDRLEEGFVDAYTGDPALKAEVENAPAPDPARLAELIGPSAAGAHYYVSGTPAFVERTSAAVRRLDGSTRSRPWRVHTDSFSGY